METDRCVVLATERYGRSESWKYCAGDVVLERRRDEREGESRGNIIVRSFKSVFLPQGYPESVSEDYVHYQFWDTVQLSVRDSGHSSFSQRCGVGNQEATVAAATVTWLLRDGTGMLGRILFAWQKGSKLDSEAKKWRLFADVLNDIAMFMEISAPYFPACFTLIVGRRCDQSCLTVHQARRDNMADISAKDGSQETLVNLAGLLISLILIPLVTDNPILTLSLFFFFTILHLFANYKAVRAVVMDTFNEARLSIVLQQYLRNKQILCPLEANQREPVLLEFRKTMPIKLGVRLQEVVQSPAELNLALKETTCLTCWEPEASVHDEIRAMCQAVWLSSVLSPLTSRDHPKQKSNWEMVHESHKLMDTIFNPFLTGVEAAGWDIKRTLLDWDEWRVEFPLYNPRKLKKWLLNMKWKDWTPSRFSVLCIDHFEEQCIDRSGKCVKLREDAVPTIFSSPGDAQKRKASSTPRSKRNKPPGVKASHTSPSQSPTRTPVKAKRRVQSKEARQTEEPAGDKDPKKSNDKWRIIVDEGLLKIESFPHFFHGDYCEPRCSQTACEDPEKLIEINRELKDQLKVSMALVVYHQQTGTLDLVTQQMIDRMVSDLIEEHAPDWDVYLPAKVFSLCFKEHSKTKERPFSVLCCKGPEPVHSPRGLEYVYSKIRESAFVVR
ncbi:hypothetical protein F7725_003189 [Dissostichus mawsoni]|uniref:THAP-type domain-containing protein n=1 Tax=Dissostichus mawsoni TaxID=36200 RepID=A0A7J5YAW4_DISMA|nr:hypothetical protein F7725_003189 [Dissostichus mawsoni]